MSVTRLKQLDKILTSRAHAKVNAELDADFASLKLRAANDPDCKISIGGVTLPRAGLSAEKVLNDLRQSMFKAAAPKAVEAEIEALLSRTQPIVSLDQLLYPEMIKISPAGDHIPVDGKGHVAVLLPAYGLMYDAGAPFVGDTWQKCVDQGSKFKLLGHVDWQLWSDKEAGLVINRKFRNPAIDVNFFPNTPTDKIWWTRTPLVSSDKSSPSGGAFYVSFDLGLVLWYSQHGSGFARFVRRVPASQ